MNRAQRAIEAVHDRPRLAVRLASELLEDSDTPPEERARASWALGRALSELDRIDQACTALEEGLLLAVEARLGELAAEIRVSLSVCRLTSGDTAEARSLLLAAESDLVEVGSRGRLAMQQGLIDLHLGQFESAIVHLDRADRLLAPGVDDRARARVLINRGIVNAMNARLDAGEADFTEAQRLAEQTGQQMLSAGAAQNLGFVAGRKGDVPSALAWFTRARAGYAEVGSPPRVMATLESDLCSVLLSGGLYAEAAVAARQAAAMAADGGNRLAEAEALLLLARVCVADGEPEAAEQHSVAAAQLFVQSDRGAWAAMADYIALQAIAQQTETPDEALLGRAAAIAEQLLASGWVRDSLEVRTFAGRVALGLGRADEARHHLEMAAEARQSGSSAMRANAWLAAAMLHLADGDRAEARSALSTGMEIVEEYRSSLASTELRANASINGAELAEVGLRLATEDGDSREVLRWAERKRGGMLDLVPIRDDPESRLAKARVELRQAYAATLEATAEPDEDGAEERVASLEREIRDLSRAAGGEPEDGRPESLVQADTRSGRGPAELASLQQRLGPDTLINYFTIGPDLYALLLGGDTVSTHRLGPMREVANDVRNANSALARLAFAGSTSRSAPRSGSGSSAEGSTSPAEGSMAWATERALRATAARLDDRLLGGLGLSQGNQGAPPGAERNEVVIVPTGALQSLAWAVLPSLAERAVSIAPSATLWKNGRSPSARRYRSEAPVLVCGPNLAGGRSEIEQLAELYDHPTILVGADASVAAVSEAIEQANLVHIAAHGTFRADNPMFSALELHDGPLTVHDLETLSTAPDTVILSACDAGRSSGRFGDDLLGTASALLQLGVGAVIAPVTVVPDATVVPPLMVELHRAMRGGAHPTSALVSARHSVASHEGGLTAGAFIAIGTS